MKITKEKRIDFELSSEEVEILEKARKIVGEIKYNMDNEKCNCLFCNSVLYGYAEPAEYYRDDLVALERQLEMLQVAQEIY